MRAATGIRLGDQTRCFLPCCRLLLPQACGRARTHRQPKTNFSDAKLHSLDYKQDIYASCRSFYPPPQTGTPPLTTAVCCTTGWPPPWAKKWARRFNRRPPKQTLTLTLFSYPFHPPLHTARVLKKTNRIDCATIKNGGCLSPTP